MLTTLFEMVVGSPATFVHAPLVQFSGRDALHIHDRVFTASAPLDHPVEPFTAAFCRQDFLKMTAHMS